MLSRIFCAAAFWSPFFVAMAVALTSMHRVCNWAAYCLLAYSAALAGPGADSLAGRAALWETFEGYPLRLQTWGYR